MSWIITVTFTIYVIISLALLGSYFYFIFYQKDKHARDKELGTLRTHASFMLNRVTREWWLWLTHPLEEFLVRQKVHPDTITWLGFGITALSCVGYSFGWFVFAGWCVLLGGTMDIFDGRVARRLGLSTKSGEFLDANIDRLGEALTFLGLLNYYTNTLFFYVVFIAFLGAQMVSYAKARAESMTSSFKVEGGIMQRAERIVWIGVPSALSPLFASIANYFFPVSTTWLASIGITIVAIMVSYSFYERLQFALKKFKDAS